MHSNGFEALIFATCTRTVTHYVYISWPDFIMFHCHLFADTLYLIFSSDAASPYICLYALRRHLFYMHDCITGLHYLYLRFSFMPYGHKAAIFFFDVIYID